MKAKIKPVDESLPGRLRVRSVQRCYCGLRKRRPGHENGEDHKRAVEKSTKRK